MESSGSQATGSLLHKFKILNITGLGHYRCYTKKLQKYLSGNPETISQSIQPYDLKYWPSNLNKRTFTRQLSRCTTKFFSAIPRLSENESCNRHSLCRPRKAKKRKEVSPQNILEYSYSGVKRICGECGLQVFELDFAFICSDCGQLIHKGCTDVCKRRHGYVTCGGETNASQIYPFCQINNLSKIFNGGELGKRIFKVPTRTHATKCFPIIRPLQVTTMNPVSRKSLGTKKRRRQSKRSSEYDLLLPSKRRKIEVVKPSTHRNRQTRRRTRRNKKTPGASWNSLHTAGNTLEDVSNDELTTSRCRIDRRRLNNRTISDQKSHTYLKEDISIFVSKTMDFLGYGFEMIKFRQRMYHADDELTARFTQQPDTRVTTGGKGEGTAMYCENDEDYLYVVKQLICTDYPQGFIDMKNITIFKTERNIMSPGYKRLELLRFSGRYRRNEIKVSLIESQSGSLYLSNEAFIDSLRISQEHICNLGGYIKGDRSGPSTPISDKYNSCDDVLGLPCCCPDLFEKWFARPRNNRWPTEEVLHAISLLDAHVVPVGFKGSPDQYLEWRICFSLEELHLMQTLNVCQIQTYILLKKIAKTCLQPISKDINFICRKKIPFYGSVRKHQVRFSKRSMSYID
ncbi:uncharacterized protein LOC128546634 [Mercenaria mercenaria]|uniref:uncharacterized protein LOC128546634 n=1 Tax=Mercenaria mercenaria TaxID=6596 RepID=UPI00234EF26B|nr:uncharacterized protein LOC128546634 [Mercenaria mercenaria]